jgi:xylose isomerase
MLEGGELAGFVEQRYSGWHTIAARNMLEGRTTLAGVSDAAVADDIKPVSKSGRQEYLENVVSRYLL